MDLRYLVARNTHQPIVTIRIFDAAAHPNTPGLDKATAWDRAKSFAKAAPKAKRVSAKEFASIEVIGLDGMTTVVRTQADMKAYHTPVDTTPIHTPIAPVAVPAPVPAPEPRGEVIQGHYAIEVEGTVKFYKVDRPTTGCWAGYTFVKVQASDDYYPVKNPAQRKAILSAIAVNPVEAAVRYGRELGKCAVCNRTLTDADSIAAGIGPICAEKF